MPEWLKQNSATFLNVPVSSLLIQLTAAIILGGGVALIYRWSHGRDSDNSHSMLTTLVLLSALIAMVSIVIGDSVARAFSLVGALSIVRFRTVVDDTRDTAFVIFAVIVGMAAGAGLVLHAAVALPVIGLAAIALSRLEPDAAARAAKCRLGCRLARGRDPEATITDILERHFTSFRPVETSTARQGSALEITYEAQLKNPTAAVWAVRDLNQTDGVMSVEIRQS